MLVKRIYLKVGGVFLHNNYANQRRNVGFVPQLIQTTVTGLQSISGLPWWATLASSTAFVRLLTLPLARQQLVLNRKLAGAMPELNFLLQLSRQRLTSIKGVGFNERIRVFRIFLKGARACLILHDVSLLSYVLYPAINFTVFVTFVFSLRDMITSETIPELQDGGLLWFTDLTRRDPTFFLPFTALGLSYGLVDFAFLGSQGRVALLIRDILQTLLILSVPMVMPLPAGIFFYWIPSSMLGIGQTMAFRSLYIQKILRIPSQMKPPHLQK